MIKFIQKYNIHDIPNSMIRDYRRLYVSIKLHNCLRNCWKIPNAEMIYKLIQYKIIFPLIALKFLNVRFTLKNTTFFVSPTQDNADVFAIVLLILFSTSSAYRRSPLPTFDNLPSFETCKKSIYMDFLHKLWNEPMSAFIQKRSLVYFYCFFMLIYISCPLTNTSESTRYEQFFYFCRWFHFNEI